MSSLQERYMLENSGCESLIHTEEPNYEGLGKPGKSLDWVE